MKGRHFAVQGDSFSSVFQNAWQKVVIARTGMDEVNQDARPGRSFATALECYGNPVPGGVPGVYDASFATPLGTCGAYNQSLVSGTTLAQNMAGVDLLVIQLGTNDVSTTLGTLGDATTTGTFYGNMRWVVETYLNAKPSLRIVLVTLQQWRTISSEVTAQYANATVLYGKSMGIPVVDMHSLGGVNSISAPTLLRDNVHPSDFGFANNYGPVIAQQLQQVF